MKILKRDKNKIFLIACIFLLMIIPLISLAKVKWDLDYRNLQIGENDMSLIIKAEDNFGSYPEWVIRPSVEIKSNHGDAVFKKGDIERKFKKRDSNIFVVLSIIPSSPRGVVFDPNTGIFKGGDKKEFNFNLNFKDSGLYIITFRLNSFRISEEMLKRNEEIREESQEGKSHDRIAAENNLTKDQVDRIVSGEEIGYRFKGDEVISKYTEFLEVEYNTISELKDKINRFNEKALEIEDKYIDYFGEKHKELEIFEISENCGIYFGNICIGESKNDHIKTLKEAKVIEDLGSTLYILLDPEFKESVEKKFEKFDKNLLEYDKENEVYLFPTIKYKTVESESLNKIADRIENYNVKDLERLNPEIDGYVLLSKGREIKIPENSKVKELDNFNEQDKYSSDKNEDKEEQDESNVKNNESEVEKRIDNEEAKYNKKKYPNKSKTYILVFIVIVLISFISYKLGIRK